MTDAEKINKLVKFVSSIADHLGFNETDDEFRSFYVKKENQANDLLDELGEV